MSNHPLTSRVLPATAAVALALAVTATAAGAATSHHSPSPFVKLAQGAGSAKIASAKPLDTTDPNTPMNISIILRTRNLAALESKVQQGWSGSYLTTGQFANAYGQTPQVVGAIEKYLRSFGITTKAYSDRLDISAVGTAAQIDKALHITEQDFRVKQSSATIGGKARTRVVYGSKMSPQMPANIGDDVLTVLGLSNYSTVNSQAVRAVHHPVSTASRPAAGTGIPEGDGLAPADFVNRYDLAPLETHGALGQGETIGIISFAGINPSTPLAFWNKVLGLNVPANKLSVDNIDGGAGPVSLDAGSDETDLDVEQSGAIAPKAHVKLYLAPNTDPGFADSLFAEASQNIADTTSLSWGSSDTIIKALIRSSAEPKEYAQVYDEGLLENAAQGQSSFIATGDFGAYQALADAGTTNVSTGTPSDSPYTTAAGGTTLPGAQTYGVSDANGNLTSLETVNIPKEIAWGWDYLYPLYKIAGEPNEETAVLDGDFPLGGNGGYSTLEPRPSYQQDESTYNFRHFLHSTTPQEIAPGLTEPTEFQFHPAPSLGTDTYNVGRATPDVSTDGDPQTGYAVYDPTLFGASAGGDDFAQFGGTSFVAPQLNGANAVIESAVGHRTGLWNPVIYSAAYTSKSPFTPVNETTIYKGVKYLSQSAPDGSHTRVLPGEFTSTNLFYTGRPGTKWNPATGLGIPDLTGVAALFHH